MKSTKKATIWRVEPRSPPLNMKVAETRVVLRPSEQMAAILRRILDPPAIDEVSHT
jgi:hypothetical protein